MKYEEAVVDYLSRVVGTLVGELHSLKVIDEYKAEELITIVQTGIDEISTYFKFKKIDLDAEPQI